MKSPSASRILLVDDSRGDTLLIDKAIRLAMPETKNIESASTLADALRLLSQFEYDIALLDRSLPDAIDNSGLQSIQNIAPQLPVIYLTGHKNEASAAQAIEDGAQDYILKDKADGETIRRAIHYAIIRKQFENELMEQANYDRLTGLANRLFFEKRLESSIDRVRRYGGGLGIFFLDLNRFKTVNDAYGHAMGDRLLAETGKRLKMCLRAADVPARFGGDEFAILIEEDISDERCAVMAQKLITVLEEPFTTSGIQLSVGVSIGIAICAAGSMITKAELVRRADEAMYKAKKSPTSTYLFWLAPNNRQASVA